MENLQYTELKIQNYFVSHKINTKTAQNIYCYRTKMAGVKVNFRSQFQDIMCLECKIEEDSQEHLLHHINYGGELNEAEMYQKLFTNIASDNLEAISLLEKGMKRREKFLPGQVEDPS